MFKLQLYFKSFKDLFTEKTKNILGWQLCNCGFFKKKKTIFT